MRRQAQYNILSIMAPALSKLSMPRICSPFAGWECITIAAASLLFPYLCYLHSLPVFGGASTSGHSFIQDLHVNRCDHIICRKWIGLATGIVEHHYWRMLESDPEAG